jgi:hypothetical protein
VINFSQFFEEVYVPTYLADANAHTVDTYRESVHLLNKVCGNLSIHEINLYSSKFIEKLKENGWTPATIAKHCDQLNAIFMKLGPKGIRNKNAKGLLAYTPYFQPPTIFEQLPPVELAPAFQFHSKSEIIQFYLREQERLENSVVVARTSGGTILTIVKLDEEISHDNTNNTTNAPSNGNAG